jgi:carboxyl-terminal processing protease
MLLLGTGGSAQEAASPSKSKDDMMELYGLFVDTIEQIEHNYVKQVDRKELIENALRGLLTELDDYSSFLTQDDWKQFRKSIESYTGIGIQVGFDPKTGRMSVMAPLVGSPAYKAGVMAGDIILQVDGQSTENWTMEKAVEALSGRPGTEVKLELLHSGRDKPESVTVRREIIELPSVLGGKRKPDDSWDFMLDPEQKIGYIRLASFSASTKDDLKKALDELTAQGMKGLILDLRDNPGGYLSQAVEISDLFLDGGRIVSTRGRNTPEKVYDATRQGTYEGFPIIVIVNQNSASASEILAAALQDHQRAKVVGQRTWGKGSVQNIMELDGGRNVLRLTVATYWRPSGKNIHRFRESKPDDEWGVSPDPGLEVKVEGRDYVKWAQGRLARDMVSSHNPATPELAQPLEDKPLEKALEVLKADLAAPKPEPGKSP